MNLEEKSREIEFKNPNSASKYKGEFDENEGYDDPDDCSDYQSFPDDNDYYHQNELSFLTKHNKEINLNPSNHKIQRASSLNLESTFQFLKKKCPLKFVRKFFFFLF